MRRIIAQRETRLDLAFHRLIPNPALLQKRLDMTGKNWTVGKYAMTSLGIAAVIGLLVAGQGAPLLLALFAGLLVGLGIPHMLVGMQIARRVAQSYDKVAIDRLYRAIYDEHIALPTRPALGRADFNLKGAA